MKSILMTSLFAILLANVRGSCNVNLTSNTGSFQSPNYPQKYGTGMCQYSIIVPVGKVIQLTWKNFNVGALKQNGACPGDTVTVYDGTMVNNNGARPMCGNTTETITSSGNKMTIILKSKTNKKYPGFSANYMTMDVACNGMKLTTDSGFIASPNYPNPYPSGSNCLYKIEMAANRVLALGWYDFNVNSPVSGPTCSDYVEVYDKHPTLTNKVYRYCQTYMPPQFTSSSNVVYIRFVSSSRKNTNHKGFVAFYHSGVRKSCNVNYLTASGVLAVPNITSLKGKDLDCKLNIKTKLTDVLRLTWIDFGSQLFTQPNSCQNSIEIYGGQMSSSNLISKKCNSNIGSPMIVNGSNAVVHYKIKNYQTNKNFRLTYVAASKGILHKKIVFKNATCTITEYYYNTPFGKQIIRTDSQCGSATISTLPMWASIVIAIVCCLIGLGILIGIGRCTYRAIKKRRSPTYRSL